LTTSDGMRDMKIGSIAHMRLISGDGGGVGNESRQADDGRSKHGLAFLIDSCKKPDWCCG